MSTLEGNCPACGAQITFNRGSSVVRVCDYCHSVVARSDRALEDLGKVAELAETNSPLEVGLQGSYRGIPFVLTGRAQLGHEAGGLWDEWYASFQNGWLGWLAEAQGRFYMTFKQPLPDPRAVPPFSRLQLGQPVPGLPVQAPMMVAEKGRARALGASGEIPYRLVPGDTNYYADLAGAGGAFGTLDYGEFPPLVFLGEEVTLDALGIPVTNRRREVEAKRVTTAHLNCPNCGGGLELRAPDRSERVTCPNCDSLLDVNEGQLKFLKSLGPRPFQPLIPIGSLGVFEGGIQLMVIGFMARSVEIEGTSYYWTEYLLYHPQLGFRWLVNSDDHWNFVEPVSPGEIIEGTKSVKFRGENFKIFQSAAAKVEYVIGEFYWKVEVNEGVYAVDYVRPPLMLSKEVSIINIRTGGSDENPEVMQIGEINWSLGKYVPPKEVQQAFGVSNLPSPSGVAPNQPFRHKAVYKYWLLLLPVLLLVALVVTAVGGRSRSVTTESFELPPLPNADGTQVVFSKQFNIDSRRNISVAAQTSTLDNSWVYLEGDLINDETGLVQSFPLSVEYYHGVEDGESWSEGGTSSSTTMSSLPAGAYTMRIEAQWEKWQQPMPIAIKVEQNVTSGFNLLLAFLALSIVPVLVLIWHGIFEKRRWSESMYGGSESEDSSD